jgi:hypothetical protein
MFAPGERGNAWEAFHGAFDVDLERFDIRFNDFVIGDVPPEVGTAIAGSFRRISWDEGKSRITEMADQDVDILFLPAETSPGVFPVGYGDVRLVVEPAGTLLRVRRLAQALSAEARRRWSQLRDRDRTPTPADLLCAAPAPVAGDVELAGPGKGMFIDIERATFLVEVLRMAGVLDECVSPAGSGSDESPVAGLVAAHKLARGGQVTQGECRLLADAVEESTELARDRLVLDERESEMMAFLDGVARWFRESASTGLSVRIRPLGDP